MAEQQIQAGGAAPHTETGGTVANYLPDLRDLSLPELRALLSEMGEAPYRAEQIYRWLHQKLAGNYEELRNLPKAVREALSMRYSIALPEIHTELLSRQDETRKFVFRMQDGQLIESVFMKYQFGVSVCISSQAGCRMGCRFCASTLGGLARNLSPGEMLSQVYQIQKHTGERVSHVVLMGSGEPLENYDALLRFLRTLTSPEGLCISRRNVTVSTCGIVPGIRALAKDMGGITLALSLHAPEDKLRRELMPVAREYPLKEVFSALREYFAETGRRVTLEYALLEGVNASPKQAVALSDRILSELPVPCHVNLIPVNPVRERGFRPPARAAAEAFQRILKRRGIPATIRRELGADIAASCGQLRHSAIAAKQI